MQSVIRRFGVYKTPVIPYTSSSTMPSANKSTCRHGPTNQFTISTPLGNFQMVCCPKGIHSLDLPAVPSDGDIHPDMRSPVEIVHQLYQDNGYTYKPALKGVDWLKLYFQNSDAVKTQPLPPICHFSQSDNKPFTHRVWETLASQVGYGQTVSYGELAELSGSNKQASRAVGHAMRTNPVSIIVPCHRVILSNGTPGNYSGGQKNCMKIWLLQHEGALSA